MSNTIFYIIVMAVTTYLVRVLPLTFVRRDIKNVYIRSFLHYVPFVTLAVMIFPAILDTTASTWSALTGFIVALILAYNGASLVRVALFASIAVFLVELFIY